MTRVALFGGSFNPPHVAHELVALYVLETQPVDELWLLPVYQHVFDEKITRVPLLPRSSLRRSLLPSTFCKGVFKTGMGAPISRDSACGAKVKKANKTA